ncbi:hypothetical protein EDC39_101342 [Geothermobacter ehrlichii]|uniref:FlgN protein n=1 Tax=Geothermobacter ehrlichii TaxID=213224 RepID=A0A5D3WMU9_9BACT|nr:hypothetical protein [Geothermobacter ehrlichii]TYP00181.1 hypothetical protein EDC39_101342 [Geothermobacter ehrlichii]
MNATAREKMEQLHGLILEERQCAIDLDTDELVRLAEAKNRLLAELRELDLGSQDPEEQALAETIREENRRNAYLFWSSLNWVRDMLNFYSRQMTEPAYNPAGQRVEITGGGKLLSGKV